MGTTSHIEISRSALGRNIRYLKKRIGHAARFTSVVKGHAYGHGIEVFLPLAEECGVRSFAVFSADEALTALQARTANSEIMVMGFMSSDQVEWAVEHGVALWVHDLRRPQWALQAARRCGKAALLHLEVETGLRRTGLEDAELDKVVSMLRQDPEHLHIEGVCTHLAGAESTANYLRIQEQIKRFEAICSRLQDAKLRPRYRHMASSAAALTQPESVMDLARIGIAQYGFWPSVECKMRHIVEQTRAGRQRPTDPLRRILTWKSVVMATKIVDRGEYVGYGNSHLTTRPTRLAIVPVGYAHGFGRNLSNLGHVLIRGRRAPVAGFVGMNLVTVDVTDTPGVQQDDEVVLIGRQGRHEVSVASFSEMSQHLNYEMLTRLPTDIPRVVVE